MRMEPAKTLNVSLPIPLVAELKRAADADEMTVAEFVQKAVQRSLEDRQWQRLYAYGEQQARNLGIEEADVDRIVHQYRQEERERQSKERGR